MADTNTTTTEEEKKAQQYISPWQDEVNAAREEYERQKEADDARIQQLSKGRDYWVGANMLANALGNLINVYGVGQGAAAAKMPDMDNSYMKVWRESDEIRRANRQRMKDHYDRLRAAQIHDEIRHNATVEGQQYAEQQRKIAEDKVEKELQDRIVALKTQYPNIKISDEQWRMWAKDDKFMPDEVRKSKENEAFKTKIAQQKELDQLTSDKEAAEIRRIKGLYPAEANITDDEAWAIYKGHGYSPRLHKWLTDNGYQTQSFNKRKGTVSFGSGGANKKDYNIEIGDFVFNTDKPSTQKSKIGALRSAVLKAIHETDYYKNLTSLSDEKKTFATDKAAKWDEDDLSAWIDYFGLIDNEDFRKKLTDLGFVNTTEGEQENQPSVTAGNADNAGVNLGNL